MPVASTIDGRDFEMVTWSDPLVRLQVQKFRRKLAEYDAQILQMREHGLVAEHDHQVLSVARELCEWSRQLLNRAFGRTTRPEYLEILGLYREASKSVTCWASAVADKELRGRIHVYAKHIEGRGT